MSNSVWTGSFRSNNIPGVYGNLWTMLKPLNEWNYKTKVKVNFTGFAAVVQNIFNKELIIDVKVADQKKFELSYNKINITFNLDKEININDNVITGTYTAKGGNYESHGELYLQKGDGNYENSNCVIC